MLRSEQILKERRMPANYAQGALLPFAITVVLLLGALRLLIPA